MTGPVGSPPAGDAGGSFGIQTIGGGGSVNKTIIGGMAVVGTLGVLKSVSSGQGISRPLLGTVVVLYVLSILDMFGGPASRLASAIAMVAVVGAILDASGAILALTKTLGFSK